MCRCFDSLLEHGTVDILTMALGACFREKWVDTNRDALTRLAVENRENFFAPFLWKMAHGGTGFETENATLATCIVNAYYKLMSVRDVLMGVKKIEDKQAIVDIGYLSGMIHLMLGASSIWAEAWMCTFSEEAARCSVHAQALSNPGNSPTAEVELAMLRTKHFIMQALEITREKLVEAMDAFVKDSNEE